MTTIKHLYSTYFFYSFDQQPVAANHIVKLRR